MKKLLIGGVSIISVVAFSVYIDDPLNALVSFIVAGVVPGTEFALGAWPSLALAGLLILAIRKFIHHIRLSALKNTAEQIKAERLQTKFKESHAIATHKKSSSVIAAPTVYPTSV